MRSQPVISAQVVSRTSKSFVLCVLTDHRTGSVRVGYVVGSCDVGHNINNDIQDGHRYTSVNVGFNIGSA